jgi:hypothetical protein
MEKIVQAPVPAAVEQPVSILSSLGTTPSERIYSALTRGSKNTFKPASHNDLMAFAQYAAPKLGSQKSDQFASVLYDLDLPSLMHKKPLTAVGLYLLLENLKKDFVDKGKVPENKKALKPYYR